MASRQLMRPYADMLVDRYSKEGKQEKGRLLTQAEKAQRLRLTRDHLRVGGACREELIACLRPFLLATGNSWSGRRKPGGRGSEDAPTRGCCGVTWANQQQLLGAAGRVD